MRVIERSMIFDAASAPPERKFSAFAGAVLCADGTMLVTSQNGSAKNAPDTNARTVASTDGGRTWEPRHDGFETTLDNTPGSMSSLYITELPTGALLGHLCWFDRTDPTRPLASPETQGILPSKILVAESSDSGVTWGPRREVPLHPHTGNAGTGPVFVLTDGILALPYESWKEYDDTSPGTHAANFRLSSDGGATWGELVTVAHHPQRKHFYWDQRLSVSPDDGRLVAMFWTYKPDAEIDTDIHISWGSPDGREWTQPVSTGIAGQITAPLALPNGRLFAAYVHRHWPPSLRAVLSDDFGKSWTAAEELVFYESPAGKESGMDGRRDFGDYWADMAVWSFGHPRPLLLPDGTVFVVFYGGDTNGTSIQAVKIEL